MSFDLQTVQTPLQDGTQIEIPKRELEEVLQSQNNLQMPSIHQIQGEMVRLEVISHEDRRNLTYHMKVLHPQHHQMKELYGVPHRLLERHHHTP
jgi:hypothetical protein